MIKTLALNLLFFLFLTLTPHILAADIPIPPVTGDNGGLGTIEPPDTIPTVTGDPSSFVGKLIKNGISLLLIVSFIIFFIWTLLAGLQFIFASGDEKAIGSAWSRIYWGMIGIAVVLSSYAIVKLVEIFFNVDIFTNFKLPGS
ncbi:hypothetical protein HY382_00450 [Candidatus Curtissbacteria bacterium]|nr:hypothetical protein [Candidatus Curtissbacteria bacterium]